jgi:hypothetical protein
MGSSAEPGVASLDKLRKEFVLSGRTLSDLLGTVRQCGSAAIVCMVAVLIGSQTGVFFGEGRYADESFLLIGAGFIYFGVIRASARFELDALDD